MRETVASKAERLILQRRVFITAADSAGVAARVRGDHGVYVTSFEHGSWTCSCPHVARTTLCSHARAVAHVWVPNEMGERKA
jgi:hypothetical protein